MKKVLIVAADPLFANFFSDGLQALGFEAQTAHTIDAGIVAAWDMHPDLVLLDPVFPEAIADPVERIRSGGRLISTPFIGISRIPEIMTAMLARTGIKLPVTRSGDAVTQVMGSIHELAGGADPDQTVGLSHLGKWRLPVMQKSVQSIASLRLAAHSLVKSGYNAGTVHTLFFEAHTLSQCTEIAGFSALHKMTSALEDLIVQIKELPANLNPSTMRTLTQAIDFLEMLFLPNNIDRITDPAMSQLFAVDDDQNLLSIIKESMEAVGLHTDCVTDPLMALEMAKGGLFNLIFLDVGMPGMNGFDLCTKIREIPAYKSIPIVFVTGMATFTNQVQSKLRGGNDFIAKPFNVAELSVKALMWIFKEQLGLV